MYREDLNTEQKERAQALYNRAFVDVIKVAMLSTQEVALKPWYNEFEKVGKANPWIHDHVSQINIEKLLKGYLPDKKETPVMALLRVIELGLNMGWLLPDTELGLLTAHLNKLAMTSRVVAHDRQVSVPLRRRAWRNYSEFDFIITLLCEHHSVGEEK